MSTARRRFGRSVTTRVLGVALLSGAVPLLIAAIGITWLVTDDKEAMLVESAIGKAAEVQRNLDQRVGLARAQLNSVAMAADEGRLLLVPELVTDPVVAVRCLRADVELVDAATDPSAARLLRDTAPPEPGRLALTDDGRHAVVRTRLGEVDALALLDMRAILTAPDSWTVRLEPERAGDHASGIGGGVLARRDAIDGEEVVTATAPTSEGPTVSVRAPIAPARAAAYELARHTLLWSLLAFVPLLVLGVLMARAVTAPVRKLAEAVRTAAGPVEPPPLPPDEIGDLGTAIEGMSERLHDDARVLRGAVRFARQVGRITSQAALLAELERLLDDSFPDGHWRVVPAGDLDVGQLRDGVGIAADRLREVLDSAAGAAELDGTEPEDGITDLGRGLVRTVHVDDHVVISLTSSGRRHGVVVGRGPIDETAIRLAELLCRTAVSALANQDLQRAAVTNEKLALLGRISAGVAHEMNNPLAFVAANLSVLEKSLDGELHEMARDAREGTDRLERIVSDLSSISRGGETDRRTVEAMADLAHAVMKVASLRRPGARIEVRVEKPVRAKCDRLRLEQALLNMTVNAIDAVPADREPQVTLRVHGTGGGAVIDVIDNGPGIPGDVRARVFDPFFTTKGHEGTGLGLFLSRSFAEAHGGTLEIAETGPAGTVFRLALPAHEEHAVEPPSHAPTPSAPPIRREVLIVDDEPAIVRAMTRLLRRRAEITGSTDPMAALDLAKRGDYSLVLCDLHMPAMSGKEFRAALESARPELASRVVIMTGSGDCDLTGRVLRKPIDPRHLEELLDAM